MPPGDAMLKEERSRPRGRTRDSHRAGDGNGRSGDRNGHRDHRGSDDTSRLAAKILVAADPATAAHSEDVELLVAELCERLGVEGEERETTLLAARLHDVGKVAVPLAVLEKPSALDRAEWDLIKEHTVVGERIVASVPELSAAAVLVRNSHEHFDGSGYPDGLSGDEIPLGSRIVLCADAFHAIRCDRPYRDGRSTRAALDEIEANSGGQFDPHVVDALVESVAAARTPMAQRMPRRVAVLLATLAIGTGGAYAAERGWVPSPIPGLGPEKSSDESSSSSDQGLVTTWTPASPGSGGEAGSASGAEGGDAPGARGDRDGLDPLSAIGAALLGDRPGRGGGDRGEDDGGGLGAIIEQVVGGGGSSGGGGGSSGGGGESSGGGASGGGTGGGSSGGGSFSAGGGSGPSGGGGSPGNSGNAPGHGGSSPGNSGSAPGQSGSTPGQSGSSPGHSGSNPGSGGGPPGQSGSAPGLSGSTPGQSGLTPGNSGAAPGLGGTPPGQSGSPPGLGGTPPGQSGGPPGNSGSAPGQNRP